MNDCCDQAINPEPEHSRFRRVLWVALAVNAAMFTVELTASFLANSVAVQADALDFHGDAGNYAISLMVLARAASTRAMAAMLKAMVMGAFGLWVLVSTVHNALNAVVPEAATMSAIGVLALVANIAVAALLFRHRGRDSNALSVWLCSRNDAIANVAVIAAGVGVWSTGTPWPDILVATAIAGLGLSAATRVLPRALEELRGARVGAGD